MHPFVARVKQLSFQLSVKQKIRVRQGCIFEHICYLCSFRGENGKFSCILSISLKLVTPFDLITLHTLSST
jgi:hypothetical protein